MGFPIKAFEDLPSNLHQSSYIDLFLFLAELKPALRIWVTNVSSRSELKAWCRNNHFYFVSNEIEYFYIASDMVTANRVEAVDNSFEPHEYELGLLLGYPSCCCAKISSVGEDRIDEWEEEFLKKSIFEGEFALISPAGYRQGYSLISHIPCSTICKSSLKIAQDALNIIKLYSDNEHFYRWGSWIKK